MSNETGGSGQDTGGGTSGGTGGPRRRRPPAPTIELTATEVGGKPAAAAADTGAPNERAGTEQGGTALPPSGGDSYFTSFLHDIPWRPLAAGAGGAVVVVLLAAGLWALFGAGGDAGLADRLARAESQLQDLSRRPPPAAANPKALDDLAARIARLEQAPAAALTSDPAVGNRLSAVEASARSAADGLANLHRRADDTTAAVRALREKVEVEAKSVSDLSRQAASPAASIDRADLAALGARVSALETAAKSLKDEVGKSAAEPDRAVRLAVIAVALKSAVEGGKPYAGEVAAIRALLADPKPLESLAPFASTGLPAVAALAREFSSLVPKMLSTVNVPAGEPGFMSKLQANAERLVRIRPVSETQGDDPAAVIARMEIKAGQGDFAAALADMAKLPPDARAAADAWSKKASARLAAVDAAHKLTIDALAGLGPIANKGAAQGGQKK